MIVNGDITIYNRRYDPKTRLDTWQRSVICGVHIYVDHKAAPGDNGVNHADLYKIRIPAGARSSQGYICAQEWRSAAACAGWTLQNEDVVVLGICDLDIERPSDLSKSGLRFCRITSWADNRFGSLPHWRIGGE